MATGDKVELRGPDGNVISIRTELAPGGPHAYDYNYVGPEGGGHVMPGPTAGIVKLSDGSVYDITPEFVPHLPGHAGPLTHHAQRMIEQSRRFNVLAPDGTEVPFTHTCTDFCGDEATPTS